MIQRSAHRSEGSATCRQGVLAVLVTLLVAAPTGLQAEAGPVCVEDPVEAIVRFLHTYQEETSELAVTRGVSLAPFDFLAYGDAGQFRRTMATAAEALPGSLLAIYFADATHLCAFAWHAGTGAGMIYARRAADREALQTEAAAVATLFGARVPRGVARSADRGGTALAGPPAGPGPEERLRALADVLGFDALAGPLADSDSLVLLLPGPLAAVPLLALPLDGERPLVETHAVTLLSGLGDLIDDRWGDLLGPHAWRRPTNTVVAVADPETPPDGIDGLRFARLPGAAREAAAIAARTGGRLIAGAEADRAAVLGAIAEAEVFHYAGHAVADLDAPLDGSFLALSDGALDARTIQSTWLGGRPLVVLSACDTGRGQALGAGIVGLARAFQIGGALGTVLSHWPVSDISAEPLMIAFHEELDTAAPAEALRRAALRLRPRYPDPADWAAFTYFGPPQASIPP